MKKTSIILTIGLLLTGLSTSCMPILDEGDNEIVTFVGKTFKVTLPGTSGSTGYRLLPPEITPENIVTLENENPAVKPGRMPGAPSVATYTFTAENPGTATISFSQLPPQANAVPVPFRTYTVTVNNLLR